MSPVIQRLCGIVAVAALLAACGGNDSESSTRQAPDASAFPSAEGKSVEDLIAESEAAELVLSPVGQVYRVGENRFGFGVFEVDRSQVLDAEVAMYFEHADGGPAIGPFPAAVESMQTRPAFAALTTYQDDHAALAVYVVSEVPFDRPGEWRAVGLIRDGDDFSAARLPSPVVGEVGANVPDIGDRAPFMHTPTPASVGGDLAKIDTRVPPTDMHTDLAAVLGKRPVVLLFATPQLCQARVCGPVVDVQAQVEAEFGDEVEFIHMEIFNDNDPNRGYRPQVRRYNLPTEPWLFAIDADGIVVERIEGAFGLDELRRAVRPLSRP